MRVSGLVALLSIVSLAAAGAAAARDLGPYPVRSGVAATVLDYATYDPATCYFAALPVVRVITPPAHGTFSVVKSAHVVDDGPCAGKTLRSTAGVYRSKGGFRGRDEIVVDVGTDLHVEALARRGDTIRILVDVK